MNQNFHQYIGGLPPPQQTAQRFRPDVARPVYQLPQ
jgi:hypothetical protein